MSADLLWTFVRRRIQPLHQRGMNMWMYPMPSYLDCPFSAELDDTEINTWIQGVLAHVADLNFGSVPVPLREGVKNPWVSPLELILVYLCQFLLLNTHAFFLCAGSRVCTQHPVGVTLPEDAARQEANRLHREWLHVWRQRRWAWSAA
jgi:hypothetical protein